MLYTLHHYHHSYHSYHHHNDNNNSHHHHRRRHHRHIIVIIIVIAIIRICSIFITAIDQIDVNLSHLMHSYVQYLHIIPHLSLNTPCTQEGIPRVRQQLPEGFGGERRRAVENKDPWQHFVYPADNRLLFTP